MTTRRAAAAVVLTLVFAALTAGLGACAAAGASGTRSAAASSTSTRSASTAACAKRTRARAKCRRARVEARYKRGPRRGRALLGRALASPPIRTTPSAGGGGAVSGPSGAPTTPAAPGPVGTPPPAPAVASSVGAEAYDFGSFVLRLTRTSVPAGDLTIYFRNHDVSEHNLWLDPPSATGRSSVMISEAVGEGGGATKTVPVTPGAWRLYCSLDGHGVMTRDLAVE